MGCAFVVRPGQERRGLADTLTLFPRRSTSTWNGVVLTATVAP